MERFKGNHAITKFVGYRLLVLLLCSGASLSQSGNDVETTLQPSMATISTLVTTIHDADSTVDMMSTLLFTETSMATIMPTQVSLAMSSSIVAVMQTTPVISSTMLDSTASTTVANQSISPETVTLFDFAEGSGSGDVTTQLTSEDTTVDEGSGIIFLTNQSSTSKTVSTITTPFTQNMEFTTNSDTQPMESNLTTVSSDLTTMDIFEESGSGIIETTAISTMSTIDDHLIYTDMTTTSMNETALNGDPTTTDGLMSSAATTTVITSSSSVFTATTNNNVTAATQMEMTASMPDSLNNITIMTIVVNKTSTIPTTIESTTGMTGMLVTLPPQSTMVAPTMNETTESVLTTTATPMMTGGTTVSNTITTTNANSSTATNTGITSTIMPTVFTAVISANATVSPTASTVNETTLIMATPITLQSNETASTVIPTAISSVTSTVTNTMLPVTIANGSTSLVTGTLLSTTANETTMPMTTPSVVLSTIVTDETTTAAILTTQSSSVSSTNIISTIPSTTISLSTETTANSTTSGVVVPSIEFLATLNLTTNAMASQLFETNVTRGLAQFFANVIGTQGSARRRRSTSSFTASNPNHSYTVTVCNVADIPAGVSVTFFVDQVRRSTSPPPVMPTMLTAAYLRIVLSSRVDVLLMTLQTNNINAAAAVVNTIDICNNRNNYIKIDLQTFPNVDGVDDVDVVDIIGSQQFLLQIQDGLGFAFANPSINLGVCGALLGTDLSFTVCEIMPVPTATSCDVSVLFVFTKPDITTSEKVTEFSTDLQFYGISLNRNIPTDTRVVYALTTPCLITDPSCNNTVPPTIITFAIEDFAVWGLPVIIVLAVLLLLCIAIIIFLLINYCCKSKHYSYDVATETTQELENQRKILKQLEREKRYLQEKVSQLSGEKSAQSEVQNQEVLNEYVISGNPQTKGSTKMRSLTKAPSEECDASFTTVTSTDDSGGKYSKPSKHCHRAEVLVERPEDLFEDVTRFSREPDSTGNNSNEISRFQTSVHPVSLPPIQPPLMSEQLRQVLGKPSAQPLKQRSDIEHHRNKMRNRSRYSHKHNLESAVDENMARVYAKEQQSVDDALEPAQPSVFDAPKDQFHNGENNNRQIFGDPDHQLLVGEYDTPPVQVTRISPQNDSSRDASKPDEHGNSFSDDTRRKIAYLLEDAFSLVSPSTPQRLVDPATNPTTETVSPFYPETFSMPQPHGRGSRIPRKRLIINPDSSSTTAADEYEKPLLAKRQPPLVQEPHSSDRPATYVAPALSTFTGGPTYITPAKKISYPPGNNDVWNPYQSFDEFSKIKEELDDPSSLQLPNSVLSPSQQLNAVNSPLMQPSAAKIEARSCSDGDDDDEQSAKSSRSAASLVKGIKEELARITGRSTPVETLSNSENSTHL